MATTPINVSAAQQKAADSLNALVIETTRKREELTLEATRIQSERQQVVDHANLTVAAHDSRIADIQVELQGLDKVFTDLGIPVPVLPPASAPLPVWTPSGTGTGVPPVVASAAPSGTTPPVAGIPSGTAAVPIVVQLPPTPESIEEAKARQKKRLITLGAGTFIGFVVGLSTYVIPLHLAHAYLPHGTPNSADVHKWAPAVAWPYIIVVMILFAMMALQVGGWIKGIKAMLHNQAVKQATAASTTPSP